MRRHGKTRPSAGKWQIINYIGPVETNNNSFRPLHTDKNRVVDSYLYFFHPSGRRANVFHRRNRKSIYLLLTRRRRHSVCSRTRCNGRLFFSLSKSSTEINPLGFGRPNSSDRGQMTAEWGAVSVLYSNKMYNRACMCGSTLLKKQKKILYNVWKFKKSYAFLDTYTTTSAPFPHPLYGQRLLNTTSIFLTLSFATCSSFTISNSGISLWWS